jgi:hypothetical protein
MLVRYRPHADEPQKVGWLAPALDLHGRPLYNGQMVAPDSEDGFDPKVKHVFEAHKIFEVDERADPVLAAFVSQDSRFTTTNKRGGMNITRAGQGI